MEYLDPRPLITRTITNIDNYFLYGGLAHKILRADFSDVFYKKRFEQQSALTRFVSARIRRDLVPSKPPRLLPNFLSLMHIFDNLYK